MSILNQFQITDKIASSGQPTEAQFEEIAANGYEAVINLAMPDHKNAVVNEGSIVTSLGMAYIHIPVPFDAPNQDHLAVFSGCMDTLKNKKVWVHCVVNARVSAFLFCYLQKQRGLSAQASVTPILERWLPEMDAVWREFISHAPEQL
ncbi:phosphatase [Exilibacterium tricleocarpae]|uniref:Phosphatase n=1 Tax=Exilibacterium tricleocarpae TaxID=2591008 RepID=A0A545U3E7_9GAMM|nr:protein tyrosine phosphatase family protein [Exilibacterium tricleocarpae]TQV84000.1 phosphatase [Exilibacterium tricleocarpae]